MTRRSSTLFVLWREPTDDGHRHVVGHLRDEEGDYHFTYVADLQGAKAAGFQLFIEFPEEREQYKSRYPRRSASGAHPRC